MNTYSISEINQMNLKHGGNWIKTNNITTTNNNCILYPTGDATIQSGRIYVALPSNIKMTDETRKKYNII